MIISHAVDPIEKKPLYHFEPRTFTYSIAAGGCNLNCDNCQNWTISQLNREKPINTGNFIPPREVVLRAQMEHCSSISFTYTEPTIWFEYMRDVGRYAHEQGLSTVMVTNGTITSEALAELIPSLDAYCVDIKGFSDEFYQKICHAPTGTLEQVLSSCKQAYDAGLHVEVVYLLIPGENDSREQIADLCDWIVSKLSNAIPLHFTRYHPQYKMNISATPISSLESAYRIATEHGILYPYIGNVPGHEYEHTYCPGCRTMIIKRDRFVSNVLLVNGCCQRCGYQVVP
jgi:pyruvate formate lyase activating enzyme